MSRRRRFPFSQPFGAEFSADRVYRYTLWRIWDASRAPIAFIGLNPSTADERRDDPTVRRCIGFAKLWGAGGLVMLNAFSVRSTDPRPLYTLAEPVGPDNDARLVFYAGVCSLVVAAWGVHGAIRDRGRQVAALVPHLQSLGVTKAGHPRHPLYLRATTLPRPFQYAPYTP